MKLRLDRYGGELMLGPLYVQVGGGLSRWHRLVLWDGLHLWWGGRGVHMFWERSPYMPRLTTGRLVHWRD